MSEQTLSNLSREDRRFEPPADLAAGANVTEEAYARADADREAFWAEAADRLEWGQKWDQVLDWSNPPFAKWFVGGTINASVNCVDRHVAAATATRWRSTGSASPRTTPATSPTPSSRTRCRRPPTRSTDLGVQNGDRSDYMPMIPEVFVAMLACARPRRPAHRRVRRFSPTRSPRRITDCEAHVVITSDGGFRRGAPSALKPAVDEAVEKTGDLVRNVLVVRRTGQDVDWHEGRDVWWHDAVDAASAGPRARDARLGAPALRHVHLRHDRQAKGILHTTGGYLTGTSFTHWEVFDPQARDRRLLVHRRRGLGDRPLLHGLRPARERRDPGDVRGHAREGPLWQIIQDLGVTIFYYTAPPRSGPS